MLVAITSARAQSSLTYVNPGSSPDATDGDTIRNAFIKCNNDFTYIGGQLNSLNSSLSGLATTYDPFGMAILIGLNATNYVRYAVGTNTVGWLGCLNAESNVLQSDITALTNNVNSLWTALGGSGVLHSGGVMAFDQQTAYPQAMQIYSDGNGNLTVVGSIHGGQLSDSYNSTPAAGMVATSQGTDGTWQWQALPTLPATLNFDSGNITSDGSGNANFVSVYAQQLKDLGGNTGAAGNYAQANGSGGWFWTAGLTTLNYDSGNITSDGAGDLTVGQNLTVNGSFSSDRWQFYSDGSGDVTAQNVTIGQNVTVDGSFSSDSGQFYSDGSGNVTAQTFNPASDRALKEQITPLAPSNALAMTLGLTNYSWRFKAHTNFTASVVPAGTRLVTTNFIASGTNTIMVFSTNKTTVAITNLTAKVFPPSGREFGPMAQDWHLATGLQDGHKISATSEAGLLIGAVQRLASLQNSFTNTGGARFALVVNAQTNGFVFVPQ